MRPGVSRVLRLLGPVRWETAGGDLDLGTVKQRTVLAVLAADAGRLVSWSQLVDRVWDEGAGQGARQALYTYATRVRRVLAAAGAAGAGPARLLRRPGGYLLEMDPRKIDVHQFDRLVAEAADPSSLQDRRARLLEDALALWHGVPLADLPGDWAARMRISWQPRQVDVALSWAQTRLRLGEPEPVIGRLRDLVADHPLMEPLMAALIQALAAAGRQAEALQCYAACRARLADELGTEPGSELRELHEAVLRGSAVPRIAASPAAENRRDLGVVCPVPAQLPADVPAFAGRTEHLTRLDALLPPATSTTAVITAVSGTAGIGKTTLAVHWAHQIADQFPGGQLYVNLRGYDPSGRALDLATAVRGFLDALGVPPERIPTDLDTQTALYRSMIADKRMLVIIDNARDADHARPLLPGAPGCLAVVTSRDSLTELVAGDGAHALTLDLLTHTEARELLSHRLTPCRVAAEPAAVNQIITTCAGLPLALALIAARAATHPRFPLTALAAELSDTTRQLNTLDTGEILGQLQAVFSWSYTTLTPPAARVFRLLGLHPGPHISTPAAASLAGLSPARTRPLLAKLIRAGLLTEPMPGRYGFHDLLRAYATHLTHTIDSDQIREMATLRMLDHYAHTAHTADHHMHPDRDPVPMPLDPAAPGTTPEPLADQQTAIEWLNAERPVLLATQQLAANAGRDTHTWQLAWALNTVLRRRGRWHEQRDTWQTALPAAGRLPHPAAAYAHSLLGDVLTSLGDADQADTHLHHALHLYTKANDPTGQAHTHHVLSYLWERRDRLDRALDHARVEPALAELPGQGERHETPGGRRQVHDRVDRLGGVPVEERDRDSRAVDGVPRPRSPCETTSPGRGGYGWNR